MLSIYKHTYPSNRPFSYWDNILNLDTKSENTYTVWTSVANPGRPTYSRGPISKIFWKSMATVWACIPNLRSDAMATQSLPFMAITAAPLYAKILCKKERIAIDFGHSMSSPVCWSDPSISWERSISRERSIPIDSNVPIELCIKHGKFGPIISLIQSLWCAQLFSMIEFLKVSGV